jgi:ketol-acid reductoisomerase
VLLVAPVGPGVELRARYATGGGIPAYVAVGADRSGRAWPRCLAYAKGLGCLRAGAFETTIAAEAEVDLFGEQAVLCGGVSALLSAAFDVLVEAGYEPEMAYLECVHQVALLANLIPAHGIGGMRRRISRTALFGDLTRGPRIVGDASRAAMRAVLAEVRDGSFAREWTAADADQHLARLLSASDARPIEKVGAGIRRLVDSSPGEGGSAAG